MHVPLFAARAMDCLALRDERSKTGIALYDLFAPTKDLLAMISPHALGLHENAGAILLQGPTKPYIDKRRIFARGGTGDQR